MPVFRDRVKDLGETAGFADVWLSGTAPLGYQSFFTAFGVGVPFLYCIVDNTTGQWETGTGYLTSMVMLVRDSVFDGSDGVGVKVNFMAGTKDVFCTIASHWCEDTGALLHRSLNMALP